MKTVWFKGEYVGPILDGSKRDTIRKAGPRVPRKGDRVAFSVGPRPPFAEATVCRVSKVSRSAIGAGRLAAVDRCLGACAEYVKIEFTDVTPRS